MAKRENKYSIKSNLLTGANRRKTMDGPWKPTISEALEGYYQKISKLDYMVFVSLIFIAEKSDPKSANSQDSKGIYYNSLMGYENILEKFLDNKKIICTATAIRRRHIYLNIEE